MVTDVVAFADGAEELLCLVDVVIDEEPRGFSREDIAHKVQDK